LHLTDRPRGIVVSLLSLAAVAPSRVAWRSLCEALDAEREQLSAASVASVDDALTHWPARLRSMPGRWMHALRDGNVHPALPLIRRIEITLFAGPPVRAPYAWATTRDLRPVESLRLWDDALADTGCAALAESPWLTCLTELALATGITSRGFETLARWPCLSRLATLDLARSCPGPAGIEALAAADLTRLRALHLGRTALTGVAARALGELRAPALDRLDLDAAGLTGDDVRVLAESGMLRPLRELNLSNNAIGRTGCEALAGTAFDDLRVLFLHGCQLVDDDVRPLLESPLLSNLRNLALSENALGDSTVAQLAECDLGRLDELDVCHNPFDPAAAETRLRAAPGLPALRRLCV
jgi:hypothetical protein